MAKKTDGKATMTVTGSDKKKTTGGTGGNTTKDLLANELKGATGNGSDSADAIRGVSYIPEMQKNASSTTNTTNSSGSGSNTTSGLLAGMFNSVAGNLANGTATDSTGQVKSTSASDIQNQSAADRLWESLDYSYGKQRERSNQSYDEAIANADRLALQRGMQRSSYTGQTLANLMNQKIEAGNDITAAQIADYQNRLTDLENQEWQRDFSERQFAESTRQYNENLAFQKSESARDQSNQDRAFDYTKSTNEQQIALNLLSSMLETNDKPSDALLKQAGISRKDYEQMKTQAVKTRSSGGGRKGTTASTPWDQLGISESEYATKYPDLYKAYTGGSTTSTTPDWLSLLYGDYSSNTDKDKKQKPTGNGIFGAAAIE